MDVIYGGLHDVFIGGNHHPTDKMILCSRSINIIAGHVPRVGVLRVDLRLFRELVVGVDDNHCACGQDINGGTVVVALHLALNCK